MSRHNQSPRLRDGPVLITVERLAAKLDLDAEIASLKAGIPEGTVREGPGIAARAFFLDIPGAGTHCTSSVAIPISY